MSGSSTAAAQGPLPFALINFQNPVGDADEAIASLRPFDPKVDWLNRNLYVNGASDGTVSFWATSGWGNWTTVSTNITLNAGRNTIELEDSDGKYLNIDQYQLTCVSGCVTY